ncbi:MAG TPA: TetR/AcrR family transcriptional regulator [Solirubrobacterales bacterium]|nr:TetR/AcrR family transcriptional regulator [Solirubrobacterales bacterium]
MTSYSTERPVPGKKSLPREFIVQHQRARLIRALAEEAAEKGFGAVTVAGVVKRAGMSRKTFYENFGSKEDCFIAAQEHAMALALERVVEAAGSFESWPQRVCAGLAAFLECVAEEPALAKTCVVEALAAGPTSIKRYEESQQTFVSLFRLGRHVSPHGEELPEALEEAIVGGIFWIVYQRLIDSEPGTAIDLLPGLAEFVLTPYLGTKAARELSRIPVAEGAEAEPPG